MRRYEDVEEKKGLQELTGTVQGSKCKYGTILSNIEAYFIKKTGDEKV